MVRLAHYSSYSAGWTGSSHQASQVWNSDGVVCSHGYRLNREAQMCTWNAGLETGTFATIVIELDSERWAASLTAATGT